MEIVTAVFLSAWLIGAVSFFLGLAEIVATARSLTWVYSLGIVVIRREVNLPERLKNENSILELRGAKAKVISANKMVFRRTVGFFGFNTNTFFPIKGEITKENGVWTLKGRIPIFSVLFLAAWLVGWSAVGIRGLHESGLTVFSITFLAMGWVLAVVTVIASLFIERNRVKHIVKEIEARLSKQAG